MKRNRSKMMIMAMKKARKKGPISKKEAATTIQTMTAKTTTMRKPEKMITATKKRTTAMTKQAVPTNDKSEPLC